MMIDVSTIKKTIKPKADSTLRNMKKDNLIEYIRCLENNYNTAVWFNENQARYIESLPEKFKWISVNDKLPEQSCDVLVCCLDHLGEQITSIMNINYSAKYKAFNVLDHFSKKDVEKYTLHPAFWMPMPKVGDLK